MESKESPSTARFQELLQMSIDTAKSQQTLTIDQKEVEKNAPWLKVLDRESYIVFKSNNDVYVQSDGTKTVIQRMDPKIMKVCAKYMAFMNLADFRLLDDAEILAILDKEFRVETSTNYLKVLKALYMKPQDFSSSAIDKYINNFLQVLEENPTFENPARGGAAPKILSQLMINGIQPEHFRESLDRYATETIMATKLAINTELPLYERSIDLGMVPAKRQEKPPPNII